MDQEYDVFLQLPDGMPVWVDHVHGLRAVHEKLAELSKVTKNECFAMHLQSKEIVARVNAKQL